MTSKDLVRPKVIALADESIKTKRKHKNQFNMNFIKYFFIALSSTITRKNIFYNGFHFNNDKSRIYFTCDYSIKNYLKLK